MPYVNRREKEKLRADRAVLRGITARAARSCSSTGFPLNGRAWERQGAGAARRRGSGSSPTTGAAFGRFEASQPWATTTTTFAARPRQDPHRPRPAGRAPGRPLDGRRGRSPRYLGKYGFGPGPAGGHRLRRPAVPAERPRKTPKRRAAGGLRPDRGRPLTADRAALLHRVEQELLQPGRDPRPPGSAPRSSRTRGTPRSAPRRRGPSPAYRPGTPTSGPTCRRSTSRSWSCTARPDRILPIEACGPAARNELIGGSEYVRRRGAPGHGLCWTHARRGQRRAAQVLQVARPMATLRPPAKTR